MLNSFFTRLNKNLKNNSFFQIPIRHDEKCTSLNKVIYHSEARLEASKNSQINVIAKQKLAEGFELKKQGKFQQSLICYVQVLNLKPESFEAHQAIAEVFFIQGKLTESKFHESLATEIRTRQRSENSIDNNIQSFKQEFKKDDLAMSNSKNNVVFKNEVNSSSKGNSNLEKTFDHFDHLKVSNQENNLGIKEPNTEYFSPQKQVTNPKLQAGKILLEQALFFYEERKWREAIAICQKVLQSSPELAEAHKIWGNCLQNLGHTNQAIEQYAKAIEINPDFAEVYVNMGSLLANKKKWNQALKYYDLAVEINPCCAAVYRNLAKVWEELKDKDKAQKYLLQAINLEPETLTAERHLQLAEELDAQNNKAQAIACCQYAIKLKPAFDQAYEKLIDILEASHRWQETGQYYRQLIALKEAEAREKAKSISQISPSPDRKLLEPSPAKTSKEHSNPRLAPGKLSPENKSPAVESSSSQLRQLPQGNQPIDGSVTRTTLNTGVMNNSSLVAEKLQLANICASKNQWQQAIGLCKQAVRLQPDSAIAYSKLAEVYRQINKPKAFITCLYRAYVLSPESVPAKQHFILGNILVSQGQIVEAVVCFRKALELDPKLTVAKDKLRETVANYKQQPTRMGAPDLNSLAASQGVASNTTVNLSGIKTNDPDEMLAEIVEDENLDAETQNQNQSNTSEDIKLKQTPVKPTTRSLTSLSNQTNLTQAILAESQNYHNLGIDAQKEEDWRLATICYRRAIKINPHDWRFYCSLGEVLCKQKLWQEAVENFSQAIKINPKHFWVHHNLGEAHLELKQWEAAAESFNQAIELNSSFSWSHYKLGTALVELKQINKAASKFCASIELNPDFDWVHHQLGDVLVALENWDGAVSAYRRALEITPDLPKTSEKLNDALRKRSEFDRQEVQNYYQTAIEQEPGRESLYYKSLEVNPEDAKAYVGLAQINAAQGNKDTAIAFYKIALQLEPSNSAIASAMDKLKS